MKIYGKHHEKRMSGYFGILAVIISFLPMLALYVFASRGASEILEEIILDELKDKSVLVASELNAFYAQRVTDIRVISQADVLEGDSPVAIGNYLSELTIESGQLQDIVVVSLDGQVIARAVGREESHPLPEALMPYLRAASSARQGEVVVSDVIADEDRISSVFMVTPVTDESNARVIKLLVLPIGVAILEQKMATLGQRMGSPFSAVYIVNSRGEVIAATNRIGPSANGLSVVHMHPGLLDDLSSHEAVGSTRLAADGEDRRMAGYADLARFGINAALDWRVVTLIPAAAISRYSGTLKTQIATMTTAVAFLVFFVFYLFSRRVLQFIWEQANYDPLSLLPNRRLFVERLHDVIRLAEKQDQDLALFYVDIDNFKEINDTLGHATGDDLIVMVSKRIKQRVQPSDILARIGGDEFALLISHGKGREGVDAVAARLLGCFEPPFPLGGGAFYSSASVGVTMFPGDGKSASQLLKNADQAMYYAKRKGGACFSNYTSDMLRLTERRAQLVNDLRHALSDRQFELRYQPICHVETERVVKMEALLRWIHPGEGEISPDEFIGIAEETRLINEIGDWVFRTIVKQLCRWRIDYDYRIQVSLNVSPVQLLSAGLCDEWIRFASEHDVPREDIVLEVTEGVIVQQDPVVHNQLRQFRGAGFRVAIDDFGTGYATFSYLKRFVVDFIKIDRVFIDEIANNSSDLALSEAIIVMASKLGIEVIAEGVERRDQLMALRSIGCDYVQGYYYDTALTAEDFTRRYVATPG